MEGLRGQSRAPGVVFTCYGWSPDRYGFVGGGTPTLLGPRAAKEYLCTVAEMIGNSPVEWTIEGNPESLTEELIEVYQEAGVTRLSIGVQSLDPKHLQILDRLTNPEGNIKILELLGRTWRGLLNVDLICGIPGQTTEEILSDIRTVISYDPGHVSLYTLVVEEGTPLATRIASGEVGEPDEDAIADGWLAGVEKLESLGYKQYEISNFAKEGLHSRHNMVYWHLDPYIGVGPAAVSTIPGERGALRATAPRDLSFYLRGEQGRWGVEWEEISPGNLLFEHLMMGLRLSDGVDLATIERRFGIDLTKLSRDTLAEWQSSDLLEISPHSIKLTTKGRPFLNRFLEEMVESLTHVGIPAVTWP